MAEEGQQQSQLPTGGAVIIKRVKKGGHGGHHGGAWKIAYADFVTAMMAFFLLLWLLNSVSQESLEGISNYFAPTAVSSSTSGSGQILGGKTISEEGVGTSNSSSSSVTMDLPPPRAGSGGEALQEAQDVTEDAARKALEQVENQQFEQAKEVIEQAIESAADLQQLKDSLLIDDTPEGLRIQIVDQDGLAMFPSGGSEMFPHTKRLLQLVSKVILSMPQQISVSGHTDAVRFTNSRGYSNWELSSDRANAARRELMANGVPYERVSRVVGKAETEPLKQDDPNDASNRRLSIILLRGTGEHAYNEQEEVLPGLRAAKEQLQKRDNESNGGSLSDLPVTTQSTGN